MLARFCSFLFSFWMVLCGVGGDGGGCGGGCVHGKATIHRILFDSIISLYQTET